MATFVLVHGAWEGGWYWRPLAERLRARGGEVFTPTLTGLGERAHLLTRDVDLETHVSDILGVLEYERLTDVVLVGHSYGGMVITGVADRAPDRLGALVYLDAFLPAEGQALIEMVPPARRALLEERVRAEGEGWYVPPIAAADWGITDPAQARWIDDLSRPHPFATMTRGPRLTGSWEDVRPRHYVFASGYSPSSFAPIAERLRADPSWTFHSIESHHFVNLSHPDEVADILMAAAG